MTDEALEPVGPIREYVNPDSPGLLNITEAAEYLSVPESTLRWWIKIGRVPVDKPGGRPRSRMRIWSADLDRLLEAGYREATSGPLAGGAS